ncbi:MAG: heparinase II/III family protein [Candidatus Sumerlaeota bacterium]|nr:heparinase II/III family protein [Candidatus Sumerlaeota bacterium]
MPTRILAALDKSHPRLLMKEADLANLQSRLAQAPKDSPLQGLYRDLLSAADKALQEEPPATDSPGGMLRVSKQTLARIYTLGLAWRLTRKETYAAQARDLMLHAAAFPDWNPKHFLDTAEMSNALGVGYDWLYDYLDAASRETIRQALVDKAMKPGLDAYEGRLHATWTTGTNNWNLVCNGGLVVGALAIAETDGELSEAILSHALQSMPLAMASYAPDGLWPEGPVYWWYATRYAVYAIASLQSALGSDFGLSDSPGFSNTGFHPILTTGPTGMGLNYADAGGETMGKDMSVLFWLARRFDQPVFSAYLHKGLKKGDGTAEHLLWYQPPPQGAAADFPLDRRFRGPVELAVMRSAWDDPGALFVGVKAGYNTVSHAHLDLGNFELDALGTRWARDLGSDKYGLPGYFDHQGSDAPRWSYFRPSSRSHNVPLLDNQNQGLDGKATFVEFEFKPDRAFAILDLTSAYPKARKAMRGIAVLPGRRAVLTQDEFEMESPCEFAWGMTTDAKIEIQPGGKALLSRDNRRLMAQILSPSGAEFAVESTANEKGQRDNAGVSRLMARLPGQRGDVRVAVLLAPEWKDGASAPPPALRPLSAWKEGF